LKYWIDQWHKSDGCECFKCREFEINEAIHKKCNCHNKKKDNCKWIRCGDVNIYVDCKDQKVHDWNKKCDCNGKKKDDWDKKDNCKWIKCGDVNIYIVCKDNKNHDWDKKCDCHE